MSDYSDDDYVVDQNGGVTRVTVNTQKQQPQGAVSAPATTRVYGETVRFTAGPGGSTVETMGQASFIEGQERPTHSVMATLQRINGKETVELVPGVPSSRTLLRTAIADGLVEAVGDGQYRDKQASATTQDASQGPEEAPADPGAGVFNPQEDSAWNEAIEPLPQFAYDSAAASVTSAVLQGAENLDSAAKKLAEQAGLEPAEAKAITAHGHAFYEGMVAKEAASAGITDKDGFYTWMRESRTNALHEAIGRLTAGRDISKFRMLALEFKNKTR